jgi:hypothetical protein
MHTYPVTPSAASLVKQFIQRVINEGDLAAIDVLPHLKPENPFAGKFLTEDVRHDPKTPPF